MIRRDLDEEARYEVDLDRQLFWLLFVSIYYVHAIEHHFSVPFGTLKITNCNASTDIWRNLKPKKEAENLPFPAQNKTN
jgi:hypothetical protein